MTNREKYKQAFSAIHASNHFSLEVKAMQTAKKQYKFKTVIALVAAFIMVVGCATVAYATDFCGIQRTLQLWIRGDQTQATIDFTGSGHYNMEYTDGDGNTQQQGGGGVALGDDGTETPLSEDELMAYVNMPDVVYEDDGTVWVYWFDQKLDITDRFENDVCYVKLVSDEETLYMTIKYQNGYAFGPHKYDDAATFNTNPQ